MNRFIKYFCTLILFVSIVGKPLEAKPTCDCEEDASDSLFLFIDVLSNVSSVQIKQEYIETETNIESVYFFENININGVDFLLLTRPELNNEKQAIGLLGYDTFFGLDLNNKELDYYLFLPSAGLDIENSLSFSRAHQSGRCIFKAKIDGGDYARLELLSTTSFSIEWYDKNDSKLKGYPSLVFR